MKNKILKGIRHLNYFYPHISIEYNNEIYYLLQNSTLAISEMMPTTRKYIIILIFRWDTVMNKLLFRMMYEFYKTIR